MEKPKVEKTAQAEKPRMDFDFGGFVSNCSKIGPEQAIMRLVTDLSVMTYKVLKSRGTRT